MNGTKNGLSRREMLTKSGQVAAVSALASVTLPQVHAAEDNTIRVALVGCGGRGTGAAVNALAAKGGPTKLVAMADVFPQRLSSSLKGVTQSFPKQVDVPTERQFIGFDAYQKAMDCLRPGDVVILTTPPAFRWPHFDYAIQKGIHVFMEKPTTVDGPSTRKMLKLAEEASKRNLKVGVGLMCRHCDARKELYQRIQDGQMGDIILLRAYRQQGPVGYCFSPPKPAGISELLYQVQRFHSFLWASGGSFSDFFIHNIDECCWMKDAWPVQAKAAGGRHYRGNHIDQNFDSYSVEYTFADGTKLFLEGRNMPGCHQEFASYAHGSKGSAVISTSGHSPARCRMYKGHKFDKAEMTWNFPQPEPNPYQLEWDHLLEAIRQDKPYNEAKRGAEASLVTAMGRMAAHTGRLITYDDMLNCEHEFAPDVDKLAMDSPAPLQAGEDGKYPVPQPGVTTKREF
ncbi:MAG: Gfo/Idh/MocA family protein [Gemmataceae bacterium]